MDQHDEFDPQNNRKPDEPNNQPDSGEQRDGIQADGKKSYYYSYGPFKAADEEGIVEAVTLDRPSTTRRELTEVEVNTPKPPASPYQAELERPAYTAAAWETKSQPKSRLKPMFASFLAGAVIVSSLMFASDRLNLFSSDSKPLASGVVQTAGAGAGEATTVAAGSTNSISNAALELDRPGNIAAIFEKSSPAVVRIETYEKQSSSSRSQMFDDPLFRQFFGDEFSAPDRNSNNNNSTDGELQAVGMGSGFIFDKTGYILTNQHVVGENPDEIKVRLEGYEDEFTAKLLGSSSELDLAVLKIEGTKDFPVLPLGKSDSSSIGDWVVAIGNPYGFDHTVTVGVLSAKERPISIQEGQEVRDYKNLLQTDAAINPGNSGGPLINLAGEVIGINTAVSTQAQGIGFAIPTSTIDTVLQKLIDNVEIPKEPVPFIGVQLSDIDKSWLEDLQITSTAGSLVRKVQFNTPAYQAGMREYDVITAINGNSIKTTDELMTKIKELKVGDKAKVTVIRSGKSTEITVTIGNKNDFKENF